MDFIAIGAPKQVKMKFSITKNIFNNYFAKFLGKS
jgi:hypothetical protein